MENRIRRTRRLHRQMQAQGRVGAVGVIQHADIRDDDGVRARCHGIVHGSLPQAHFSGAGKVLMATDTLRPRLCV